MVGVNGTEAAQLGITLQNGIQKYDLSKTKFQDMYDMLQKLQSGAYGSVFVVKPICHQNPGITTEPELEPETESQPQRNNLSRNNTDDDFDVDDGTYNDDYYAVKRIKREHVDKSALSQRRASNVEFKQLQKQAKLLEREAKIKTEEEYVYKEVQILHDLREIKDGITTLIDFFISYEAFYIVQTYAYGGDVLQQLSKRASYCEKDMRDLAIPLLETMKFIHSRKIVHRDLKPENLLLRQRDEDSTVLVADFGFATYVPDEGCKTHCGTPCFVAPEILMGHSYNTQVDMWSIGCIFYMLLCGYPPFHDDRSRRNLFRKIKAGDYCFRMKHFQNVSIEAKQLISSFLTVDPQYRYSANDALSSKSPWIQENSALQRQLSCNNLNSTLHEMQSFCARRKFKSSVHAILLSIRSTNFMIRDKNTFRKQEKEWYKSDTVQLNKQNSIRELNLLNNIQEEKEPDNDQQDAEHDKKMDEEKIAKARVSIRKYQIKMRRSSLVKAPAFSNDNQELLCASNKKKFCTLYKIKNPLNHSRSIFECVRIEDDKKFAVKIIENVTNDEDQARERMTEDMVFKQVAVMQNLRHDNIAQLVEFFEEDDYFYLVMEYAYGGDVFDRIVEKCQYTEKDARNLTRTLLQAIKYMHSQGFVHRDMKPQNLLLKQSGNDYDIAITDFSQACRVHAPQSITTRCGTPTYVAPEILKNIPYDESVDMWSIGVIIYVMLCGYPPFMAEDETTGLADSKKLYRKIRYGDYSFDPADWNHVSTEAKDLIKGLLQVEPKKRFSAAQALECDWIKAADINLSNHDLSSTAKQISKSRLKLKTLAKIMIAFNKESRNTEDTDREEDPAEIKAAN